LTAGQLDHIVIRQACGLGADGSAIEQWEVVSSAARVSRSTANYSPAEGIIVHVDSGKVTTSHCSMALPSAAQATRLADNDCDPVGRRQNGFFVS